MMDEMGRGVKELTVVVPAFNEASKLETTVNEIIQSAERTLEKFEIIIVNDGSKDATLSVANSLARKNDKYITVIDLPKNEGVGNAFALGLAKAANRYICLIPGDNAFSQSGISRLFDRVGMADLIVTYRSNPSARTFLRRWLSRFATLLLKLISGRSIRDAHSMFVYPVAIVRNFKFSTGYGYHMETLARLLRLVDSVEELPVELNPKPDASSGVMKFRTLTVLGITALRLLFMRLLGMLPKRSKFESN